MEFFGQGLRQKAADLARLVADFKAEKFKYKLSVGDNDYAKKDDGDRSSDVHAS